MSKYILLFRRKTQRIPKHFFVLFASIAFIQLSDEFIELLGITFENTIFDYVFDLITLVLLIGPIIFYFLKKIQGQDDILSQQESLLKSMFENMEEGVFVCDTERNLIFINARTGVHQQVKNNLPIPFHEWVDYWDYYHSENNSVIESEQLPIIRALKGEIVKDEEIKLHPKGIDLDPVYLNVNAKQILDDSGVILGAMVVTHNITKHKEQKEIIKFMAYHDDLTKLPNRTYFKEYLSNALLNAKTNGKQLAVMFLDLDGFKAINDTFGHDVGDLLLKEVAERLTLSAESENFVARMGGDEFTLVLPTINGSYEAEKVANKILTDLKKPIIIQGYQLEITSSIGVANYPFDSQDRRMLMKRADLAMYYAKKNGKNNYRLFSNIKEEMK